MHGLEKEAKARIAIDEKAKRLIQDYSSPLQNFLAKHVDVGGGAAEEIMQETFLAVIVYLRKNQKIDNERALLYKIARSKLVDYLRVNKRRMVNRHDQMEGQELVSQTPSNERALEADQSLKKVEQIIKNLPEKCRRVFILRTYHEMTPEEIAVENDISVRMVFKHMNLALKKIREQMDQN